MLDKVMSENEMWIDMGYASYNCQLPAASLNLTKSFYTMHMKLAVYDEGFLHFQILSTLGHIFM
jgi:hypothetical protein